MLKSEREDHKTKYPLPLETYLRMNAYEKIIVKGIQLIHFGSIPKLEKLQLVKHAQLMSAAWQAGTITNAQVDEGIATLENSSLTWARKLAIMVI
jgi:hypothetical protein